MLSLESLLTLLLMVGAASVVLGATALVALRRPKFYLALVAAAFVASQWRQSVAEAGGLNLSVSLGSVTFGALDALAVSAGMAAVIGQLGKSRRVWSGTDRLVGALTILTGIGIAHWIVALGLESGVNGWRTWIYALCFYWWARIALREPPEKLLIGIGVFAALVQGYGFATTGFDYGVVAINGQYFDARPIHAQSALLMVVALAVILSSRNPLRGWRLGLAVALGLSAILSLHRSVWVALLALLVVWALQPAVEGSNRTTRAARVLPMGFVLVLVSLVGSRTSELSAASQSDGTLLWRVSLWLERLSRDRSPLEWLLGGVAVPNNERDLGSFIGTSHNMYVDMFEMYGLLGLALLAALLVGAWRRPGSPGWSHSTLAAFFAFGFFYPWPVWSWILMGVFVATGSVAAGSDGTRTRRETAEVATGAGLGQLPRPPRGPGLGVAR